MAAARHARLFQAARADLLEGRFRRDGHCVIFADASAPPFTF